MSRQDKNNKVLVITGPTGIGKTELSFHIQKEMLCSIISADSRQVYKEMSIGTAKASQAEIYEYRIKCCDYVSIHDNYSVGTFVHDALGYIEQDLDEHGHSMVCGGTGMYIRSLCEGLNEFPDIDAEIQSKLQMEFETSGIEFLQKQLAEKDPAYYGQVDIQNPHRLMRALSVIEQTGKCFSSFLDEEKPSRNFEAKYLVLDLDRQELYSRIEKRVDIMMELGLLEEARSLMEHRHLKSLNTVGYSELFDHLEGNISLEEAVDQIKTHSRQYAKRQLTWFRKHIDAPRFHPKDVDAVMEYVRQEMGL